ncbi:IucA/IucC family C-terminal-domain containing protein, partial [Yersinia pestis]
IPEETMSFHTWSSIDNFPTLIQKYRDEYYGDNDLKPNDKALYSLWSQWYFGLIIPPMMLLLIEYPQTIDTHHKNFKVLFHHS